MCLGIWIKGPRPNQRHLYIFFIEQQLKTVIHFSVENKEAYTLSLAVAISIASVSEIMEINKTRYVFLFVGH